VHFDKEVTCLQKNSFTHTNAWMHVCHWTLPWARWYQSTSYLS